MVPTNTVHYTLLRWSHLYLTSVGLISGGMGMMGPVLGPDSVLMGGSGGRGLEESPSSNISNAANSSPAASGTLSLIVANRYLV